MGAVVELRAPASRARVAAFLLAVSWPAWVSVDRWRAERTSAERLSAVGAGARPGVCLSGAPLPVSRDQPSSQSLASWQTVGGCGAGASTGTGAGIKWIGRDVTGGLFRVECQGNYVRTSDGYNYVATSLVTHDLAEKWNVGVSVPYVYKYIDDPYQAGFNVANRGLADVNLLVTRRLGAINDSTLTLSAGLPTGTSHATLVRDPTVTLRQDRQLGLGKVTGALILDHTIDRLWGPTVIGGVASWRGGTNDLGNHRTPSATGYVYSGYLWGRFVPALGLQLTAFDGHDRDRDAGEQRSALVALSPSLSLEWSVDSVAILLGATLPYQYSGFTNSDSHSTSPWGFGPWVIGLGVALAP
jgi:hypothetical protein